MGVQGAGDKRILDETVMVERHIVGGTDEGVYLPKNVLSTVPEGFRFSEPGKEVVAPDFVRGWRED